MSTLYWQAVLKLYWPVVFSTIIIAWLDHAMALKATCWSHTKLRDPSDNDHHRPGHVHPYTTCWWSASNTDTFQMCISRSDLSSNHSIAFDFALAAAGGAAGAGAQAAVEEWMECTGCNTWRVVDPAYLSQWNSTHSDDAPWYCRNIGCVCGQLRQGDTTG